MRYSFKVLKDYIDGNLNFEEIVKYTGFLGLNPKIIEEKEDDVIFEIESPANRPDLLSFIGFLREILPFGEFNLKKFEEKIKDEIDDSMPVVIEDEKDCFYYSCRIVKGINNLISPQEIKEKTEKIGFRSSFLVVDLSNFVMYEIGQPLHIFDLDKIKGKIIVRRGKKGERLITIDGKERDLEDVLIIADEEKPIAIAGIMGGMNTEVNFNTKNILIESAYFNPVVVRKGSKKLGLVTEASLRFEKGLSVTFAQEGMERISFLIKKFCGGKIGKISFAGKKEEEKRIVLLDKEKIEKILGITVEDEFLEKLFKKLGFLIEKKNGTKMFLAIPNYRKDIKEDIDVIEEIAKYKKYFEIPSEIPSVCIYPSFTSRIYENVKKMKNILEKLGFYEVITLSFISDKVVEKFNLKAIKIENPLTQTFSYLRTSLIFNILEVVRYNIYHQNEKLEIFEYGKIFELKDKEFLEKDALLILSVNSDDFFNFKGKIEKFFKQCGLENIEYKQEENKFAKEGTNYGIYYSNVKIGNILWISDELKEFYDIKNDIYVCEISMEKFVKYINFEKKFRQLPKFPASQRDFSFLFPEDINWREVEKEINSLNLPIEKIEVFDIYKGERIPEGKISVSFSIIFRSFQKTLENEEIDNFSKLIINRIENKFSGRLRGQ